MDIDFPLVLTWAVGLSGLVWAVDHLAFRPGRQRRAAALGGQLSGPALEEAQAAALAEPVVVEYARSFFPVLAVVLVLRSFLGEPYVIPSGSMIPTLIEGDFILVNKFTYGLRLPVVGTKIVDIGDPERGDVMVFVPPHDSSYFIKRVIGLPGDRVRYADKRLWINGEPLPVALLAEEPQRWPPLRLYREQVGQHEHTIRVDAARREPPVQEWTVPAGHYFMMGDNRDNSADSREWGFVPERNIVGQAQWIWMHKPAGWNVPSFARNGRIE